MNEPSTLQQPARPETDIAAAVVLLSGGMDSATLLHYVKSELEVPVIKTLSFRYGQRHARELEMAAAQARAAGVNDHREVDLSALGELTGDASALTGHGTPVPDMADLGSEQLEQPPTYVPNRNMILLSMAAACAEARGIQHVFYGAQAQDRYGYWDCTVDFVAGMNDVLGLNRRRAVTVHAPFTAMAKVDVVRLGHRLGVDFGATWTCYRGAQRPCGTCPSCVERGAAFEQAGIEDPAKGEGVVSKVLGKR